MPYKDKAKQKEYMKNLMRERRKCKVIETIIPKHITQFFNHLTTYEESKEVIILGIPTYIVKSDDTFVYIPIHFNDKLHKVLFGEISKRYGVDEVNVRYLSDIPT